MLTPLTAETFNEGAFCCTLYKGGGGYDEIDSTGPNRIRRDLGSNCGPDDVPPPNRVDTTARLAALRAEMAGRGLAAYMVPLDEEERRTWISGFSGSNGDSIVTMSQAASQLDCNWELMKMGQPEVPDYAGWLTGDANLAPAQEHRRPSALLRRTLLRGQGSGPSQGARAAREERDGDQRGGRDRMALQPEGRGRVAAGGPDGVPPLPSHRPGLRHRGPPLDPHGEAQPRALGSSKRSKLRRIKHLRSSRRVQAGPGELALWAGSQAKPLSVLVEVQGMMDAHIRDAYACVEFFSFMEDQIVNQKVQTWNEITAAEVLKGLRLAQPNSKGLSFTTISASGANGAVIHYSPTEETVAGVNDTAVYLVDSGGQYLDGTTDVTRTFHYGSPDPEVVEMYTRVLMGAIDLARLVVPDNTMDRSVDLATRQHIFSKGLDYRWTRHWPRHRAYLGVHEGPTRLAMSGTPAGLRENMFFSDEPGYYKDGEYGIRLETILRVVKKDFADTNYGNFIGFEAVTLVPFEPNLIDFALMTPDQLDWFNSYSDNIKQKIRPHFVETGKTQVVDWIDAKTAHVGPGGLQHGPKVQGLI
ncbi:unnamed protein product [Sphagnum tenellum]